MEIKKSKIISLGLTLLSLLILGIFVAFSYIASDRKIKSGCIITDIQKNDDYITLSKYSAPACYDIYGNRKPIWFSGFYFGITIEYIAQDEFGKPNYKNVVSGFIDCYQDLGERDRMFNQIIVNKTTNVCFYYPENPSGVSILKSTQLAGQISGIVIFTLLAFIMLIFTIIIWI